MAVSELLGEDFLKGTRFQLTGLTCESLQKKKRFNS